MFETIILLRPINIYLGNYFKYVEYIINSQIILSKSESKTVGKIIKNSPEKHWFAFIEYIFAGKNLLNFTNLYSRNDCQRTYKPWRLIKNNRWNQKLSFKRFKA